MGNEGDTHVRERSHLQGPQLLAHPSALPLSSCLCPFLFNTIALSSSLPPYSPSIYLSIYLSCYLLVIHIPYAYNLIVWQNQMDKPSLEIFFCCKQKNPSDCKAHFSPQVSSPPPFWKGCTQRYHFAFLSPLNNVIFKVVTVNIKPSLASSLKLHSCQTIFRKEIKRALNYLCTLYVQIYIYT